MSLFDLVAKLTLDQSGYEQGLKEASGSASKFASAVGTGLKAGATAVAALGTAVAFAGNSFVKQAGEVASYGDHIDKMSQKIGISAEAYQEWDAVLQHSGASIDSLQPAMKTLATAAQNGSDAFEKLGISQEEVASLSAEDLFSKVISGLQSMGESTERTALASKLLGRGATELGALLNTSAEETQAMKNRVKELGGVLSNDAVKAAAKYKDQLQDLQTASKSIRRNLASEFLPGITKTMEGLTEIFAKNTNLGLEKISEGIDNIISGISEKIPTIVNVASELINALVKAIAKNLPTLFSSGASLMLQLFNGLVENLPMIVEAGINTVVSIADGIANNLEELVPSVVLAVTKVAQVIIDNLPLVLNAALEIVKGLAQGILNAIPTLIEALPDLITSIVNFIVGAVPQIIDAGIELLTSIVGALPDIIKKIVEELPKIIENIVNALTDPQNIESIIQGSVDLLMSMVKAIPEIAVAIVENMPQIIAAIVQGLAQGALSVGEAFFDLLFGGFSDADERASQAISETVLSMQAYADKLNDIKPNIVDVNSLLSEQGNSIWDLNHAIDEAENGITEILRTAMQEQRTLRQEDIDAIRGYRDEINRLEQEKMSIYQSQQQAIYESIKRNASSLTLEQANQMIKNAEKARDETLAAANEMYMNELAMIENRKNAGEFLTDQQYQAEIDAAERHYAEQQQNTERFYTASLAEVEKYSSEWVGAETEKWKKIIAANDNYQNSFSGSTLDFFNSIGIDTAKFSGNLQETYAEMFKHIDMESTRGFFDTLQTFKAGGRDIEGANKETAEAILGSFENLPADLDDLGKQTLLGMTAGLTSQIPELADTSEMSAAEIVDAIEKYLGIASPSKVLMEVGENTILGLIEGLESKQTALSTASSGVISKMKDATNGSRDSFYNVGYNMAEGMRQGFLSQEYSLKSSVSNMISRVNYAARAKLDINSPSKVWMKMGEQTGEGFEIGLQDSMAEAIDGMNSLFDDMSNVTPMFGQPEVGAVGNRNYVDSVVININGVEAEDIDDLAERVSEAIWATAERKETAYA